MATLLNEKNKKILEKQVHSITDDDINEVRQKLPAEFLQIETMLKEHTGNKTLKNVLKTGTLFFDILNCSDFNLQSQPAKWIGFGLKYLISPYDLIPDKIGTMGYYDDNLVLKWVEYMVENEINRYKSFILAKQHVQEGHLLEKVADGKKDAYILIPGIHTRIEASEFNINWIDNIHRISPDSSLYVYRWVYSSYPELQRVSTILNHEIYLKAEYDFHRLETDWKDASLHSELYAKSLLRCIDENKELHNKPLNIAGHSFGCRLIENMLPNLIHPLNKVIFIAAAANDRKMITQASSYFNSLINVYSEKDVLLKFLFEKFSTDHKALGLSPISETSQKKVHDVNVSGFIAKHSDYSLQLPKVLDTIKHLL
jgi:uncharacterized membrane protein YkvA (DUF1232 family)